ncbi:DM13 domain-containing protein [Candidatus Spongiisocius sp.]|uniref:DM13 domain-containing protein n=1 Tax=Candidatus Spongiisocius sp. TaxID=3101273 RepID=UPI003B5946DE
MGSDRTPFYKRRSIQVAAVIVAIPVIAFAWWLGSPLFIDQVVDEPFPVAAMAVVPADMTAEEVEEIMLEAAATDTPVEEPMPEMPEMAATTTSVAAGNTSAATAAPTEDEAPTTTAVAVTELSTTLPPEPTGPVALASGALMDADSFHMGSGQVVLYQLEDGSRIIRLEDIEVTNGPQLHVLLTPVHGLAGRDHLREAGYVDLGPLKGNIGSQNYEVPADYVVPDQLTLVIYCVPFHVVFATAELA